MKYNQLKIENFQARIWIKSHQIQTPIVLCFLSQIQPLRLSEQGQLKKNWLDHRHLEEPAENRTTTWNIWSSQVNSHPISQNQVLLYFRDQAAQFRIIWLLHVYLSLKDGSLLRVTVWIISSSESWNSAVLVEALCSTGGVESHVTAHRCRRARVWVSPEAFWRTASLRWTTTPTTAPCDADAADAAASLRRVRWSAAARRFYARLEVPSPSEDLSTFDSELNMMGGIRTEVFRCCLTTNILLQNLSLSMIQNWFEFSFIWTSLRQFHKHFNWNRVNLL